MCVYIYLHIYVITYIYVLYACIYMLYVFVGGRRRSVQFTPTDLHIIEQYRGDDWMSSFRLSL